MKTRIFQTRFYDDEDITEMNLYEQHLYLYLLTCQYINISGIFQLSVKKIQFEAKLSEKEFLEASKILIKLKKAVFYKGWVYVINARKNNNYERSFDNAKACKKEIDRVPKDILDYFNNITVVPTVVLTVPINKKPEIINKKPELIRDNNILSNEEIEKMNNEIDKNLK